MNDLGKLGRLGRRPRCRLEVQYAPAPANCSEATGHPMAAKTVSIAVADDLRPALGGVVEHFGHGSRSEFLRIAVSDYKERLGLERLRSLRGRARAERASRVYTSDEVLTLIRETGSGRQILGRQAPTQRTQCDRLCRFGCLHRRRVPRIFCSLWAVSRG